jgi:hypothetical protein
MRATQKLCTIGLLVAALAGCRRSRPEPTNAGRRAAEARSAKASQGGGPCAGVLGHPKPGCDYPSYEGFELVMAEEFDTDIDLDNDPLWTWSDGYSDLGHCRFIKDAIAIRGGIATITMDMPPVPIPTEGYPSYAEGLAHQYPADVPKTTRLSTGEIRTKFNMFRYGRYEFRVKPPTNTTGNFMASAFIFRSPKWQDWSEVDIELQARSDTVVQSNIVFGQNRPKYESDFASVEETPVSFNTQAVFRTYIIEWLPTVVNIYVDPEKNPKPIRRYWADKKQRIPDKPGKVMMNLWAYDKLDKNTYPMVYQIDWVRFYVSNLEPGNYPCANPPDCLLPADVDYSKNNANDGIPTTRSGYPIAAGNSAVADGGTGVAKQP